MTHPSVSVIIPAYRAARTIARALDSVLAQTCPPGEIVIVDDGSPDEDQLLAALEPYRDRITWIRQPNGGAASARNLGIERSQGELIAFLDADDYWEPTKLERELDVLREHPEVGLVAGRYYRQEPGQPPVNPVRTLTQGWGVDFDTDRVISASGGQVLRIAVRVWTSTVMVRRGTLSDRRFESGLEPAEDRDLWIRLLASCPVYMMSEPLATMVTEPGSLSRTQADRDYGNMLRVVRRHGDLLKRRELRDWERTFYQCWAACHLWEGRPGEALRPAWERIRLDPLSIRGWWVIFKAAALAYTSLGRGDRRVEPKPGRLGSVD